MEAYVAQAIFVDRGENLHKTVDEGLAAHDGYIGVLAGLPDEVLAATKTDLKPCPLLGLNKIGGNLGDLIACSRSVIDVLATRCCCRDSGI